MALHYAANEAIKALELVNYDPPIEPVVTAIDILKEAL